MLRPPRLPRHIGFMIGLLGLLVLPVLFIEQARAQDQGRNAGTPERPAELNPAASSLPAQPAKTEDQKRIDEQKKAEKREFEARRLEEVIRQRLRTSRETPSSSGTTGNRMSPSERSQLVGLLTEQMIRCLKIPSGAFPKSTPIISIQLSRDGTITSGPTLTNPINEADYMRFAEANMRALRGCAPYNIPPHFMDRYDEWKDIRVGIIPPAPAK